jgi:hypothetical protein
MKYVFALIVVCLCGQATAQSSLFLTAEVGNPFLAAEAEEAPKFTFVSTEFDTASPAPVQKPVQAPQPTQAPAHAPLKSLYTPMYYRVYYFNNEQPNEIRYGLFGRRTGGGLFPNWRQRREAARAARRGNNSRGFLLGGC